MSVHWVPHPQPHRPHRHVTGLPRRQRVQIGKRVVATCSGSTLQRWNAPPNILQAIPLLDTAEK